ncbi:phosphatidylserine decarboxylase family protein [Drechmeria coniospora]|uniref:Phosphatidylserine decarboxylase family protein n=1 Tax=Drechmeria coniospora TaxID=98403 RepID=A0A151GPD9_DRECN|nr:phosphatidylserine decarboxylase family protein [Drechmeria coniospora]KYK58938.1 phosphatidylserine decarboxylase family protein [Drechmeria coniospora]
MPEPVVAPHRAGGWLPLDGNIMVAWLRRLVEDVDGRGEVPALANEVDDLRKLIDSRADLRMLASAMLDEVPAKAPYLDDPVGNRQIRHVGHLLELFSVIMTEKAPEWSQRGCDVGLIGFPFNALLDWPMATPSGYAFFLMPEVNARLRAILDAWRDELLATPASRYVLTADENMWLGGPALRAMERDGNLDGGSLPFDRLFRCDPTADHWGFRSWDDFFARRFRDVDALRPVASRDDAACVVAACESRPFALRSNVGRRDGFWLKGQPYSLDEMLDGHPWVGDLVGGTVYQAFLGATSYHRWHSHVAGTVVRTELIAGTYFSEPTMAGFYDDEGPDPAGPGLAQGYIAHVATRAIFYIEADEPVGRTVFVAVGMADVSTCRIHKRFRTGRPTRVDKGEEIGSFHHGGSTHCLIFRRGLDMDWVDEAKIGRSDRSMAVRSKLATVRAAT